MTATPIVRPYPANLTPVMGTLLAWHTSLDLQAVRLPAGVEVLLLDGQMVALPENAASPTQQVILVCWMGKRAVAACLKSLRAMVVK